MEKISTNKIRENKKQSLLLVFFIFTMMFSFEIVGYNMRYAVLAFWMLFSLMHNRKMYIYSMLMMFPIVLICIIVYSSIIITIHGTNNFFEILRSARAIITYVIITMFLSSGRYSVKQIIDALSLVMLSHAICIILGIVFPPVKEIVIPISQYSKEFMPIRSSGFLSGYDDAGYLSNVGLILTLISNNLYKKRLLDIRAIIFVVAVIFTSRFNILFMTLIFAVAFLFKLMNMNLKGIFEIGKYLIPFGIFVSIVWILTTNVGIIWRSQLISKYPILDSFYNLISTSYTDYGMYTSVISRHLNLNDLNLFDIIFGAGVRKTTTDIGYIKTIYSIGVMGIIIQILTYFRSITNIKLMKKRYVNNYSLQILGSTFIAAVILMIVMETKISFIFSSTTFEMLSIMYITCVLSSAKVIQ